MASVIGATRSTVVTLSTSADATAVSRTRVAISRNGSATGQPHRQQSEVVEQPGLLDGPDDDHHAQQQEHHVPVDAVLLRVERIVGIEDSQCRAGPAAPNTTVTRLIFSLAIPA